MINVDKKIVEQIYPWLKNVRRDFHMYPELGMEEIRTSKKIKEYLEEMNIKYQDKIANTGIVALIEGEDKNYTVAFRADMDALPIIDNKAVEYKSKNQGICHACGHDSHMTMNLGIAKYFYEKKIIPPCNIKLIFQPAEETVGGAKPMIKEGAMNGVDSIFGIHITEELEVGKIGIKYGAMNASSDTLKIKIIGKSCHGAYPSSGVDAIVVAAHLITAIQTIISRNTDARDSAVITFGVISGGTQGNIIAQEVELKGTLRTLDPEVRKNSIEKITQMVEILPLSFGAKGEFIREEGYTSLINNEKAVDIIKESSISLFGEESIYEKKRTNMGVEDFAYFTEVVSGAMFNVGIKNSKKGIEVPAHNGNFDIDEEGIKVGVMVQIENLYRAHKMKLKK